jgi:alpha-L-rhamnosidase
MQKRRALRPISHWQGASCCLLAGVIAAVAFGQDKPAYLDPARDSALLQIPPSTSLPEQFIWTKDDAAALDPSLQSKVRGQNDKTAPHYFREHFSVAVIPSQATLYIAGPRSATVTLNGANVLHFDDSEASGKGFHVMTADVASSLHSGDNVLAIEEVRGHSSLHTGASPVINQVTYGEVLAVKIVPRGIAEDAPPLVVSDASWRSTLQPGSNWTSPSFDDSSWPTVQTLGALGSRGDFLQWNADAGLYAWPGYSGISPAMRTFRIAPVSVRDVSGREGVTSPASGKLSFAPAAAGAPSAVTLDFGKEISGRIHLVSSTGEPVTVGTSYGESAEEAMGHPYLGVRLVTVPAHREAYGPKSAFRYVRLTFPPGMHSTWSRIDAQGIAYPVEYKGSFESSDPQLNRIWETGAYTAHLCMQEGIWDGVKRDRGRWMGDLDVTGRVISSVFADRTLMEPTMAAIIGESPVTRDVNTIAGYSALWITGQADFYRHNGDLDYLRSQHLQLLDLLGVMKKEVDANGLFTNPEKHKVFVDWSNGFSSDTPEARAATHLEFYLAFNEASYLLNEMGDSKNAADSQAMAHRLCAAAQGHLLDQSTHTFGSRWQTNAMAVFSGAATAPERQAIWTEVLSHVLSPATADTVITPYYGYYVLSAMAQLGHKPEALDWMRQYWGGMLAEGATSFWESYDPRWPKQDFHAHLEADGKTGYYVSLAHGWASGPTAWLMEQILGIQPTAAGFREVGIRPDLAGLQWAHGTEPTPRGLIDIKVEPRAVHLTLPPDTVATVSLPFTGRILENGKRVRTVASEDGKRSIVTVRRPGTYAFTLKGESTQ